jgi:uncharacterized Zn finger protein (UPF0148 family)
MNVGDAWQDDSAFFKDDYKAYTKKLDDWETWIPNKPRPGKTGPGPKQCKFCKSYETAVTKDGSYVCLNCSTVENGTAIENKQKVMNLKKEVRDLEKQVEDLKKTRDALIKEIKSAVIEIDAKEAKEGAVNILEDMRDLTSSL